MASFFSAKPPHAGNSEGRESEGETEGTLDQIRNFLLGGINANQDPAKLQRRKAPIFILLGTLIVLLAAGLFSEKKWGIMSRAKLRLIGPGKHEKLENAAAEFRNEVYRFHKFSHPNVTPEDYLQANETKNKEMIEEYHKAYSDGATEYIELATKKDLWEKLVVPYLNVADMSLLQDAAVEFAAFRKAVQAMGYRDKQYDESTWDELFDFEVNSFKTFAAKTLSDEAKSDSHQAVQFYAENVEGFLQTRQKYLAEREFVLGWLGDQHHDIILTHPDVKETISNLKIYEEAKEAPAKAKQAAEEAKKAAEEAKKGSAKSKVKARGSVKP